MGAEARYVYIEDRGEGASLNRGKFGSTVNVDNMVVSSIPLGDSLRARAREKLARQYMI